MRKLIEKYSYETQTINIKVNIDGIPITDSGDQTMWPISGRFSTFEPFLIAIWIGTSKPDPANEFIFDFVEEMEELIHSGLVVDDRIAVLH